MWTNVGFRNSQSSRPNGTYRRDRVAIARRLPWISIHGNETCEQMLSRRVATADPINRRYATGTHASDRFPGVETPGYRHVVATRQTIPNTMNTPAKSTLDFADSARIEVHLSLLKRSTSVGLATASEYAPVCGRASRKPVAEIRKLLRVLIYLVPWFPTRPHFCGNAFPQKCGRIPVR